jgi:hypothetical protein
MKTLNPLEGRSMTPKLLAQRVAVTGSTRFTGMHWLRGLHAARFAMFLRLPGRLIGDWLDTAATRSYSLISYAAPLKLPATTLEFVTMEST